MSQEDKMQDDKQKLPERAKEKVARVKLHIKKHKTIYIASATGVGCLIVGGTAGAVFGKQVAVKSIAKNTAVIAYKSPQTVTNVVTTELARRGHPGHIIKCIETGEVFASRNRAAGVMGINRYELFQHLKGLQDTAGGFTFEILGEAV